MEKYIDQKNLIIVTAISLFMVVFGIWGVPLLDPDEPVYAETAREMIEFRDFLSPRIFNEYWYDKPPMYYWLVAICQLIFGYNEFAARLPAGLAAVGTTVMLYISVTKIFNEKAGFWSALVLTSCIQFFYLGKAAVTDTTLLFFMTGALMCFWQKQYWLMYVCMALGTLTKGPIGIVFPGAIIILYLLATGNIYELFRMHFIRGLLLYAVICFPWYYAMYTVHGMVFIETFLGFHNITRFTTPEHASRVTFWYYFPVVILGLFPWTGLWFKSVKDSFLDSRIDDMHKLLFPHIWAIFVFLFFTVCKTKLVSYILPMFPALAIVVGWNISRMVQKRRHNTTYFSWIISSGLLIALLGAGWIIAPSYLTHMPEVEELSVAGLILGSLTLLIGVAFAFVMYSYRDVELGAWLHVLLGGVTMFIAFTFILPILSDRFSVKRMVEVYKEKCNIYSTIYVDKFLRPGFMYYSGRPGIEMLPNTGAMAEAMRQKGYKYILVRGLEYRRLQRLQEIPANVNKLAEIGDIYLLEQDQ